MKAADLSPRQEPEPLESELLDPIWAVVSFDRIEAVGLTYADAAAKMAKLDAENINGLCIVTKEAAARTAQAGGPGE